MKRELTAAIAIPILFAIIYFLPHQVFLGVVGIAALLALWEFQTIAIKSGLAIDRGVGLALTTLVLLAFFTALTARLPLGLVFLVVVLAIPTLHLLRRLPVEGALASVGASVFMVLLVGATAGCLGSVRLDFGDFLGVRLVFFLLLTVWAGDSFAYYVGRNFGKHKMAPVVSPKKSWEGAAANVAGTLLVAAGIHFSFLRSLPLAHVLVAAALISVGGQLGDLVESLFKRGAAVKDSGTLLPGHGGFLDRLDSMLFAAPLLYLYVRYVVQPEAG